MEAAQRRYRIVKVLFDKGQITEFKQLVELLPHTTVAKDLKVTQPRMKKLFFQDVSEMTLKELYGLSKLLDIDLQKLEEIVLKEVEEYLLK